MDYLQFIIIYIKSYSNDFSLVYKTLFSFKDTVRNCAVYKGMSGISLIENSVMVKHNSFSIRTNVSLPCSCTFDELGV